jgi:hypothetical protein
MKKEHAEHNKNLCDKLYSEGGFNDWIVTTAFYSAIHFIDHKIFPTKNTSKTYKDIADAKLAYGGQISPHKVRGILVHTELSKQRGNYNYLKQMSHTARYVNYKISNNIVNNVRNALGEIVADCI